MVFKKETYINIIKAMMIKFRIDEFYLTEKEIQEASEYDIYKIKCLDKFGSDYRLVKKEFELKLEE